MIKKSLAIFLCIGILWTAIGAPIAQARWAHVRSITLGMSRSGNVVTSSVSVTGQSGTTNIYVSYRLEVLENGRYKLIDTWSASGTSIILNNTRQTSNCPAGTYQLSITVTIVRNGGAEVVTDSLIRKL